MNADTFCQPDTDRGFALAMLSESELIDLAHDVDRLWQAIPPEDEARVSEVLDCLNDVHRALGSLIVREDRGGQKAIVTFIDEEVSKLTMRIEFRPSVANEPVTSPAVQAALQAVDFIAKANAATTSEVPA